MNGLLLIMQIPVANAATDTAAAFGNALKPIIDNIVVPIVVLIFAVATLVFIYGVLQMVLHPTDAEAHTKGRWSMLSGVIGMFIMLSAWGIIYLVSNTLKSI